MNEAIYMLVDGLSRMLAIGEDGIGLASPHGLSGGVSGLMVFTVEDTVDVENI